jgi:hypothetical protein
LGRFALRLCVSLAPAAAALIAAALIASHTVEVPVSVAGTKAYWPYFAAALAAILSLAFNRGRAFFAVLVLIVAYVAYNTLLSKGIVTFQARTVYAGMCVFVPWLLAFLAFMEERGAFNRHGLLRLAMICGAAGFTAWLVVTGRTVTSEWAYAHLVEALRELPSPIPQLGLASMLVAWGAAIGLALARRSAV